MSASGPITFWNRASQREEVEQVYGDAGVRFLYANSVGQKIADWILSGSLPSKLYGAYQSSPSSKAAIPPFIAKFKIPMAEYVDPGFRSFNDFFIRKFKPGVRKFVETSGKMPAPAEARYLAFERVSVDQTFPVKGSQLSPEALLGNAERAKPFLGGSVLIARLCPTDYHRYHYPDNGRTLEHYSVAGRLHSVNPWALRYRDEIFATNERRVSILETENFGRLAYIEVGALLVGKIVQTHDESQPFKRGDEKGYFLFGGSTVIILGERGRWKPDADLLEQSAQHRETYVRLGEGVAGKG